MKVKGWTKDGREVEIVFRPETAHAPAAQAAAKRPAKIAAKRKEPQIVSALLLIPRIIWRMLDFCAAACWAISSQGAKQEYTQWLYGTGRYANKD